MARPLQKKKNRSSLPRIRQRSKPKHPNVKANPIIAANWNPKQTLRQNYRRLGLTVRLNASTGGVERTPSTTTTLSSSHPTTSTKHTQNTDNLHDPASAGVQDSPFAILPSSSSSATKTTKTGLGSVRVERDPVTGAITRVLSPLRPGVSAHNPLNDPLNDIPSPPPSPPSQRPAAGPTGTTTTTGQKNPDSIIPQLEAAAAAQGRGAAAARGRGQSERERAWIAALVARWGDDVEGMRRDRRLNPRQQGEGELRRKVAVWKRAQARGTESGDGVD